MGFASFARRIGTTALWAAAFALQAPVVQAAEPAATEAVVESVLTTQVDGQIVIDTEGGLVDYKIETAMTDRLRDLLQQRVRSWKFQPVLVGGKPVRAKTQMRVTLIAQRNGEDYKVDVDNVTFPGTAKDAVVPDALADAESPVHIAKKSMTAPVYPISLAQAGIQGIVLLYLRIGADGRVQDVVAVQSSLLDVRGRESVLANAVKMLEDNTVKQARRWRFDVKVSDAAKAGPEDFTAAVPVEYRMFGGQKAKPGMWRTEVRGPRKEAAWLADAKNAQKIGVSDLAGDEVMPIASAFKLQTPVAGMAL